MSGDEHHPSAIAWARWLSGEMGWLERRQLRRHLSACGACRALDADAAAERSAFDASAHRREDLELLRGRLAAGAGSGARSARARPRWGLLAVGATAAIVAIVAVVAVRVPGRRGDLLEKGGAALTLFVERHGAAVKLGSRCTAGDRVIARYRTEQPFLLLLERDGRGAVQVLVPQDGAVSARLPAMEGTTPASWILDATPGRECFVAFFSDEPFQAAEAIRRLAATADADAPPGVTVRVACCDKAPAR